MNLSWNPAQPDQSVPSAHSPFVSHQLPRWPSQPAFPWHIHQFMLSLLSCVFRPTRLLSPLPLTRGPRLLVPSLHHPEPSRTATPGHHTQPSFAPQDVASALNSTALNPCLKTPS
jgi:hypothetical protein